VTISVPGNWHGAISWLGTAPTDDPVAGTRKRGEVGADLYQYFKYMQNGNATFLRRFYLCVLLLAILPQVTQAAWSGGPTYYTWVGSQTFSCTSGGQTFTGSITMTAESYGNGSYRITPSGTSTGSPYMRFSGPGFSANWTSGGQSYTTNAEGQVVLSVMDISNGQYIPQLYFQTPHYALPNQSSLTVNLTVKNNMNRQQTISCGTAPTQTLAGLGNGSLSFVITGTMGNSVSLGSSPDMLVLEGTPDPLIIPAVSGTTASRTGHIGASTSTRAVTVFFVSYSTTALLMTGVLDGGTLGTVTANASSDGVTPKTTTYDWLVDLSGESSLTFQASSGHSANTQISKTGDLWTYVVVIDRPATAKSSTTGPAADGTITTTTTDPATGTTTIDRAAPITPINTSTNPGTILNGANTPGGSKVTTYGNTTSDAGSAASQDAANSLAAIVNNTAKTAANTQDSASVAKKQLADESGARGALTALQTEADATSLISTANTRASGIQTNAQTVVSQFGTIPTTTGEGSDPADPTVDLQISATKTITMHLNPFSSAGPFGGVIGTVAGLIKRLIAWGLVMTFLITVMKEMRYVMGTIFLTNANQSQILDALNNVRVFGNSLGVPVSVTLRVALTAGLVSLFLTIPLVISAAVEAGLPWTSLVATATAGPIGSGGPSMIQTAIGYASQVVPWVTLMSAPVYYFVLHAALFPAQAFWQMLMKVLP